MKIPDAVMLRALNALPADGGWTQSFDYYGSEDWPTRDNDALVALGLATVVGFVEIQNARNANGFAQMRLTPTGIAHRTALAATAGAAQPPGGPHAG